MDGKLTLSSLVLLCTTTTLYHSAPIGSQPKNVAPWYVLITKQALPCGSTCCLERWYRLTCRTSAWIMAHRSLVRWIPCLPSVHLWSTSMIIVFIPGLKTI